MRLSPGLAARVTLAMLCLALGSCGSKSGFHDVDASPQPECDFDSDCDDGLFCTGVEACIEGVCLPGAPVVCSDGNECTDDVCDEDVRACTFTPVSRDMDGDGYNGPRPGAMAGAPHACGDDCDDRNPMVHPGATEVCNGIDDNCNGIIDDNAVFSPVTADVPVSDANTAPSSPGGLSWSGARFVASFSGYTDMKSHVYFSAFDRDGTRVSRMPQIQFTMNQADAYGGFSAWSGERLGVTWFDRTTGDYEVWFALLDPDGELLGDWQRISFADGFSINPTITWTGSEFVLVWQDERDSVGDGSYEIYAQRIDRDGHQIGDNVRLTHASGNSESPVIAASPDGTLGVAWLDGRGGSIDDPRGSRGVWFATFDHTLRRLTEDDRLTQRGDDVVAPTVVWNRDRWVVAWHDGADDSIDHEIWGATRTLDNQPITAALRLTHDPNFSRYANLVPLGDRLVLTWADDRFGDYEIMAEIIDAQLQPLSPESRVTNAPGNSVFPLATLGPLGDVGILYQDQREGPWRVRFTRLECAIMNH